jgi:hypothetical protein
VKSLPQILRFAQDDRARNSFNLSSRANARDLTTPVAATAAVRVDSGTPEAAS